MIYITGSQDILVWATLAGHSDCTHHLTYLLPMSTILCWGSHFFSQNLQNQTSPETTWTTKDYQWCADHPMKTSALVLLTGSRRWISILPHYIILKCLQSLIHLAK